MVAILASMIDYVDLETDIMHHVNLQNYIFTDRKKVEGYFGGENMHVLSSIRMLQEDCHFSKASSINMIRVHERLLRNDKKAHFQRQRLC